MGRRGNRQPRIWGNASASPFRDTPTTQVCFRWWFAASRFQAAFGDERHPGPNLVSLFFVSLIADARVRNNVLYCTYTHYECDIIGLLVVQAEFAGGVLRCRDAFAVRKVRLCSSWRTSLFLLEWFPSQFSCHKLVAYSDAAYDTRVSYVLSCVSRKSDDESGLFTNQKLVNLWCRVVEANSWSSRAHCQKNITNYEIFYILSSTCCSSLHLSHRLWIP